MAVIPSVRTLQAPQAKMPTSNPIMIICSGITWQNPGFQYIFKVYDITSSSATNSQGTLIYYDKRPPAPAPIGYPSLSGLGVIDISKPLRDYTLSDFNPNLIGSVPASGSMINYKYTVTEEYIDEFLPNRFYQTTTFTSFSSITDTHSFIVGDRISITMNPSGNTYPQLNGIHTVTLVHNANAFQIETVYPGTPGTLEASSIIYADRRRTQATEQNLSAATAYIAYNGAFSIPAFTTYSGTNYTCLTGTSKLLTNMPQTSWEIRDTSRVCLNFFYDDFGTPFGIAVKPYGPTLAGGYPFSGAVFNSSTNSVDFILDETYGWELPINTPFSYVADGSFGSLGAPLFGSGIITGSTANTYNTTVTATTNVGVITSGFLQIAPGAFINSGINPGAGNGNVTLTTLDYHNALKVGDTFTYTFENGGAMGLGTSGSTTVLSRTGETITIDVLGSGAGSGSILSGIAYFSSTIPNARVQGAYFITGDTTSSFYPQRNAEYQMGIGPWNISGATVNFPSIGSVPPILKSSTTAYDFWVVKDWNRQGGGSVHLVSDTYRLNIDTRCSYYNRDEIEILFKDELGSFQSFTFQLKNDQTTDISKDEYRQTLGNYRGPLLGWGYNTWDRVRTVFNVDTQDKYTAVSDWVNTQDNIDYMKTLFKTAQAYWVYDSATILPIVITSRTYQTKKLLNERMVNIEIQFELAYTNPTNI